MTATTHKAKRLDKLTEAQIARFPEFVEKWTRIGLSTDPADRQRAEAGIRLAYQCAGLEPPKAIVWCGSPLSQGLTRALVFGLKDVEVNIGASVGDSVGDSVRASVRASVGASVRASVGASVGDSVRASVGASVWDSVGDSVGDSVRASVGASVWDSVRASVGASVWDSVGDSVGDSVRASVGASVGASVWDSVWDSVGDSVWDSVWDSVGDSGYGQHDAEWLAFYEYFRDACSMDETTQKLAGMWEIAQSAGWWLPHKNLCWVCERPRLLKRNDRVRLHCEDGPALEYPDGWRIWAIHGVRVDEQLVMRPGEQAIAQIDGEANAEIRRIRMERYGWPRYLQQTNARVLDYRRNDVDATDESLMQAKDGARLLVCACPSTARVYAMRVPREIENCAQAQRWLAGGKNLRIVGAS